MLELKAYQERSLSTLRDYLRLTAQSTAKKVFIDLTEHPYRSVPQLPGLPYVCLRVPTGGGKTLMACHTVGLALHEFLRVDRCVVLWLVPTNTIREQTLKALRDPRHPYRQALQQDIGGGSVTVMDLSEALYVQRGTLDGETCIIVSTLAALRVNDTEGRKIYVTAGALEHHFSGLTAEQEERLERDENGVLAYSLANILRLRRPVVIMDEAHNARTKLSFETLARFSPSCIIEFTATPETTHKPEAGLFASNVLHHVSAAELKAEQMIKMPVRLETRDNYQEVLSDALARRKALEDQAKAEEKATGEYIRPILLVQAQPRSQDRETLTVEVIKKALMEDFKVPEKEIAIATGDQREIEDVDLFSPTCPIRVILTVQQLKEGWDCSFAYVLCSVAELSSSTAVEQIIGRVLRLPRAQEKRAEDLNRAYAYVASQKFAKAAETLTYALVQNGFERFETSTMIEGEDQQPSLWGSDTLFFAPAVTVNAAPDLSPLPEPIREKVVYDADLKQVKFQGVMDRAECETLKACFAGEADRQAIERLYQKTQTGEEDRGKFPSQRGEAFPVPQLAIRVGDQLEIFEESHFLDGFWKLSECPAELTEEEFPARRPDGHVFDIDVTEQGRIEARYVDELHRQMNLLMDDRGWTIPELAVWLDRNVPHPDLTQTESSLFLHHLVTGLVEKRGISVEQLAQDKFRLRDAVERKFGTFRNTARTKAYQQLLSPDFQPPLEVSPKLCFSYDPRQYPANWYYEGSYKFRKHYYPQVGELKSEGEEFECAQRIDSLNEVRYWVRNLERQPRHSFWLQTSSDKFYPDFVVRLNDLRWLVVEYKGGHLYDAPDSQEKRALGELWAARSNGLCIFRMVRADTLHTLRDVVKQ